MSFWVAVWLLAWDVGGHIDFVWLVQECPSLQLRIACVSLQELMFKLVTRHWFQRPFCEV